MEISKKLAKDIIRAEAEAISLGHPVNGAWIKKIEYLSELCQGQARTHIAFIGTEMLAKAVNRDVDLYAIKPTHSAGNPRAYSARSLCHSVLAPLAADIGFNIGVTGREPLNNQPYFRMTHLGDGTPVHPMSAPAFHYMMGLVDELQQMESENEAKDALRAFIAVRQRYQPRYRASSALVTVKPETLASVIRQFVQQDSESGRRAQAVVAGLMDTVAGIDRVESGGIHDPSRNSPGDVCIRDATQLGVWEKAFEVRDKPVSMSDVQVFGQKCVDMGVREAAVVMVSDRQAQLDEAHLEQWASHFGIGLTLFYGWHSIVDQVLFWSGTPKPEAAILAVELIYNRLIAIETSETGVAMWQGLTTRKF
ncbi:restriction endonuclease, SacI family [Pseudomonas aeruginosa]|uniref:restriction endonuclease, SacI family n=1 Tax=Pseudomonas aeruginosa TaxID=287 RepID=UPI0020A034BE|nr:restriction endonuclease, SacI family [Pseudomonas aeruginosa]EME5359042.1 restriction endonuclease, SacI family [Pseudomonas aeruginosa]MCO5623817.1 restriction endonuclease, SacI family [Pseudomonas aeruginosa]